MSKPYELPELKDQVGWRLTDEDKRNLRILLRARGETSVTRLLRDLAREQAEPVRRQWQASIDRKALEADARG